MLKPQVYVLDPNQSAAITVMPDRLLVPDGLLSAEQQATGAILIGALAPGFSRRVVSITDQGGTQTVMTTPASLTDVFEQADIVQTIDLGQFFGPNPRGLSQPTLSFSKGNIEVGGGVTLTPEGYVVPQAPLDFAIHIQNGQVSEMHAILNGQIDFEAGATLEVDATGSFSAEHSFGLFPPPPDPSTCVDIQVGLVPVWTCLRGEPVIGAGEDFGGSFTVQASLHATGTLQTGVEYQNGQWSSPFKTSFTHSFTGPTWSATTDVSASFYLEGRINVRIWEVAGPYIALRHTLAFDTPQPNQPPQSWDLTAGDSVVVGVKADLGIIGLDDVEAKFESPPLVISESGLLSCPSGYEGALAPPNGCGSCNDGKLDGVETDVDCGGSQCPPCADGRGCAANPDCVSKECNLNGTINGIGTCTAGTCSDGIQNELETDVDCGGPACSPCALSQKCSVDGDCQSGLCRDWGSGLRCVTPTCDDGVQNQDESDVDCGGITSGCKGCSPGQKCNTYADCASWQCDQGFCAASPLGGACETSLDCAAGGCELEADTCHRDDCPPPRGICTAFALDGGFCPPPDPDAGNPNGSPGPSWLCDTTFDAGLVVGCGAFPIAADDCGSIDGGPSATYTMSGTMSPGQPVQQAISVGPGDVVQMNGVFSQGGPVNPGAQLILLNSAAQQLAIVGGYISGPNQTLSVSDPGDVVACATPAVAEVNNTDGSPLIYDVTVSVTPQKDFNTGAVAPDAGPPSLASDPCTGRVCAHVCGANRTNVCGDPRWWSVTIPPGKTLSVQWTASLGDPVGSNFALIAYDQSLNQICGWVNYISANPGSYSGAGRLVNQSSAPQTILIQEAGYSRYPVPFHVTLATDP